MTHLKRLGKFIESLFEWLMTIEMLVTTFSWWHMSKCDSELGIHGQELEHDVGPRPTYFLNLGHGFGQWKSQNFGLGHGFGHVCPTNSVKC